MCLWNTALALCIYYQRVKRNLDLSQLFIKQTFTYDSLSASSKITSLVNNSVEQISFPRHPELSLLFFSPSFSRLKKFHTFLWKKKLRVPFSSPFAGTGGLDFCLLAHFSDCFAFFKVTQNSFKDGTCIDFMNMQITNSSIPSRSAPLSLVNRCCFDLH